MYLFSFLEVGKERFLICFPLQNLSADYSLESHSLDLDHYVRVVQRRRRRAKALVDFERHDQDELGFQKNDIINVRFA